MKLRVNLLTPALLPKKTLLSFTLAVRCWLGCLLLLGLVGGYQQWQLLAQDQTLQQVKSEQQQLERRQQELVQARAAQKVSPQLQAQLEEAQQELAIKRQLLGQVQQSAALKDAPYSDLLADLARVHERNLWLDSLTVSGANMKLTGFASQAEVIPKWLSALGQQTYLQGRSFKQLDIKEVAPLHQFSIDTQLVQEQKP